MKIVKITKLIKIVPLLLRVLGFNFDPICPSIPVRFPGINPVVFEIINLIENL